jgi:hypothetical protein
MKSVTINPRDFISAPFLVCPNCSKNEFGVLLISGTSYTRRCRDCWHTRRFSLPTIRKAVIYIDQFAISNMLKVRDETTKGHEKATENPFWTELWDTLARLRRCQLICCPDSEEHENESLLAPFFAKLKSTYERLSGGVTFKNFEHIRLDQAFQLIQAWAKGKEPVYDFDAERITYGRIHEWKDRIFVSVGSMKQDMVDAIRQTREGAHEDLKKIFERWRNEKKTFEETYEAETRGYLEGIVKTYRTVLMNRIAMIAGRQPYDVNSMLHCEGELLESAVKEVVSQEHGAEKTKELSERFFKEGVPKDLPFNKISGALYAVLATKAAAGQKDPPNKGTFSDISFISTLLPYCDAMFIDNKSRALINDLPKTHALGFGCKIFSLSNKEEFLAFLASLMNSATPEHLAIVQSLYGT